MTSRTIKTLVFASSRKEAREKFWARMKKDGYGPDDLKILRIAQKRNVRIGAVDLCDIYYKRRKK